MILVYPVSSLSPASLSLTPSPLSPWPFFSLASSCAAGVRGTTASLAQIGKHSHSAGSSPYHHHGTAGRPATSGSQGSGNDFKGTKRSGSAVVEDNRKAALFPLPPPFDRDVRLPWRRLCASGGHGNNSQRRHTGRYVALERASVSLHSVLYPIGRDDATRASSVRQLDAMYTCENAWAVGVCWFSHIVSPRVKVRLKATKRSDALC